MNREKQLAQAKLYQQRNRDKAKVYWATYYARHKDVLREKRRVYAHNLRAKRKAELYTSTPTKTVVPVSVETSDPLPEPLVIVRGTCMISFD